MSNADTQVLSVHKVKATTIYKLLLLGQLTFLVPLGLLIGIAGYFGAASVRWNNETVHGFAALLAAPAISVSSAVFFTILVGTSTCLGLWVYSWFRPVAVRLVWSTPAAVIHEPHEPQL